MVELEGDSLRVSRGNGKGTRVRTTKNVKPRIGLVREDYGRDRVVCRGSHGWSWAESWQGKQCALMSLCHEARSIPWMGQSVSDIRFWLPWCCHPVWLFFSPLISFPNSFELLSVIVTHLSRSSWCPHGPAMSGLLYCDSSRSPFFPAASISPYQASPALTICPGIFCL